MFRGDPAGAVVAFVVDITLCASAEAHEAGFIGLGQLPWPAAFQPFIGDLNLPSVSDQLIKDSELIADAVSGGWDLQAGQRLHVAGREASQATISESWLFLHIEDLLQRFDPEVAQCFFGFLLDTKVQQVAVELRANQEFRGEIGHRFLRMRPHRLSGGEVTHH